mgnify:CR=1 FL=1
MGTTQAHVNIENNFQFLLFIRLWKSKGKFALSNIEEFVKLTENRMIKLSVHEFAPKWSQVVRAPNTKRRENRPWCRGTAATMEEGKGETVQRTGIPGLPPSPDSSDGEVDRLEELREEVERLHRQVALEKERREQVTSSPRVRTSSPKLRISTNT